MRGSKTRSGLEAITDPAVYQRVSELFSQAAELPVQDQAAFLREKCGGDADLLRPYKTFCRKTGRARLSRSSRQIARYPSFTKILADELYPITRSFDRWELVEWESFIAQLRCGSSEPSR